MSTLTVEAVPLRSLRKNPRNPKLHSNATIDASINRFGMVEPIVIDARTGFIVSGHGRADTLAAMRDRGEPPPDGIAVDGDDWLVPAVTSWASTSDQEAEAALVALNRTSEVGGWETRQLAEILASLTEADALAGVGYDDADLSLMLKQIDADTAYSTDQQGAIDEFLGIAGIGPEGFQVGYYRKVTVVFANEADCRAFYDKVGIPYDATERSFGWPRSLPQTPAMDFNG
jgi:hypothetical protein